jgi:hypothetical protein
MLRPETRSRSVRRVVRKLATTASVAPSPRARPAKTQGRHRQAGDPRLPEEDASIRAPLQLIGLCSPRSPTPRPGYPRSTRSEAQEGCRTQRARPAGPGILAVRNPEVLWVQVLSIVPPTSFAVMPARILTVPVPTWEIALAALLLLGGVLLVRRLAGKIFRLAMLMHGKEPGWREIRRWLAEA